MKKLQVAGNCFVSYKIAEWSGQGPPEHRKQFNPHNLKFNKHKILAHYFKTIMQTFAFNEMLPLRFGQYWLDN